MRELRDILAESARLEAGDQPYVLASVVKVLGSAYRRPGARMLVRTDGTRIGTISGGCLEDEVAEQSRACLESGVATVTVFEMGEDDHIMGFGTGCGGDVHVLLEPIPAGKSSQALALTRQVHEERRPGLLATTIGGDAPLGQYLLRFAEGSLPDSDSASISTSEGAVSGVAGRTGATSDSAIDARARTAIERAVSRVREGLSSRETHSGDRSTISVEPDGHEILVKVIHPPIRLVVFGQGHDIGPVTALANHMGWRSTVVGSAGSEESARSFPDADDHIFLMHPDSVFEHVSLDAFSAAVVMSHNFERDVVLVRHLLSSAAPFVGVLGPAHRTTRLLDLIAESGTVLTDEQCSRLFGPVGLDLGSDTPEQIALSIISEIQATFSGRDGTSLRDRSGPIHG